jgi:hypothetical protein
MQMLAGYIWIAGRTLCKPALEIKKSSLGAKVGWSFQKTEKVLIFKRYITNGSWWKKVSHIFECFLSFIFLLYFRRKRIIQWRITWLTMKLKSLHSFKSPLLWLQSMGGCYQGILTRDCSAYNWIPVFLVFNWPLVK